MTTNQLVSLCFPTGERKGGLEGWLMGKGLLWMHKDLNIVSRTHIKSKAWWEAACSPTTEKEDPRGGDSLISQCMLTAELQVQ